MSMLFRMNQPEALVDEMVEKLPENLFTSATTTFCDPAMGKGDYLVGVAKRLIKYGHTRDNILSRLYGFETSQLYINACEKMTPLKGANLEVMTYDDVLAGGIVKKFNCIVGNPPFQDGNRLDNANKLWPRFVKLSWELLEPDGVMAFVTPNGWMTPGADIGKGKSGFNIFRDIMKQSNPLVLNIDNKTLSQHFPGVGSTFSYYIIERSEYTNSTVLITNDGESSIDVYSHDMLINIPTPTAFSILANCATVERFQFQDQNHEIATDAKNGNIPSVKEQTTSYRERNYHTAAKGGIYRWSSVPHSNKSATKVMISLSGKYVAKVDQGTMGYTGMCLVLLTPHADNAGSVLNSKLYTFLNNVTKFSGFNPRSTILTFPKVDLTRPWTDEELYAHFNLTQEEIDLIEATV